MKLCRTINYCGIRANGRIVYVSSTLDGRHDCATAVRCLHGHFIEMHHEECDVLRAMNVPVCHYAELLQARDALEYFALATGRFINSGNNHSILRDDLVYSLAAFVECSSLYQQLMKDHRFDPPKCWLVGAHYLLNKYRSTNEEAK